MQRAIIALIFVLVLSGLGMSQGTVPCMSKEAVQFDFWVGKWDLERKAASGETQQGTNTVSKILGSCVIQETFDGGSKMPLRGISHSVYDNNAKTWKQTWVDNSGAYLDLTGGLIDGKMILTREFSGPKGKVMQRMVFYNITKDALDWNWENSADGGKSWNMVWQIRYKRRAS